MFVTDSLIVIGLATVSLGTIHEANGPQQHTFRLCNAGQEAVVLTQGYTSCGCTTIHFDRLTTEGAACRSKKARQVAPGDSVAVTLRFNPQGKGGDFEETATIIYKPLSAGEGKGKTLQLSLEGTCITSEETLLRQFPIRVSDSLRLSTDHFDLGPMHVGETKQRTVVLLHRDDGDRQEPVTVTFTPSAGTPKGLQHINYPLFPTDSTRQDLPSIGETEGGLTIRLDVLIK